MITKLFEIRDRETFLPMFATICKPVNPEQDYLLRRAGYSGSSPRLVLFGYLQGGGCFYDPYDWNDRTKKTAHHYIQENWDEIAILTSIDVIVIVLSGILFPYIWRH